MLPVRPPLTPMLARSAARIPDGMIYEPKWDGWRCVLFRDGERVELYSRRGTELTAYYPDLVAAAAMLPAQCVVDGEIVISDGERLTYTKLTERHTSPARARALAAVLPATYVIFDVLCLGEADLTGEPYVSRRARLAELASGWAWPLLLTPSTDDRAVAQTWFDDFERSGLDGIVAKPPHGRYQPGQRALTKIKHVRSADVVVAGYRLERNSTDERPALGSLQLGLYDDAGILHFVGVSTAFPGSQRRALADMLAAVRLPDGAAHPWLPAAARASGARVPDGVARRSGRVEEAVHLIDPLLVCEVTYDHLYDGERFRSNAGFLRWRPDRDPASCRFDQLVDGLRLDLLAPDGA